MVGQESAKRRHVGYAEGTLPTSENYRVSRLVHRYFQRTPQCTPSGAGLRAFHIQKIFTVKAQPQTALAKYIDASLFSLIPPSPALSHWREEVEESKDSWQRPSSLHGLEPQFRNEYKETWCLELYTRLEFWFAMDWTWLSIAKQWVSIKMSLFLLLKMVN